MAVNRFRSRSPIIRRSRSHPFSREPQRWDCRRLCRWREKHYNSSAMRKLIFSLLLLASSALAQTAPQLDVLIRNGRVFDGSGNPWFRADIGIVGDRITFIGPADEKATAKQAIDAKGLIVAPGFIDMLGQSETTLLIDKKAVSKLTQGITTEITGEGDYVALTNAKLLAEDKE